MSALPSLGQYTLALPSHTTIVGEQREQTVADHLRQIDNLVETARIENDLSPQQAEQYRQQLTDGLRQQINDDFQSNVRFGILPRTRTFVDLTKETRRILLPLNHMTGIGQTRCEIFERDDKTYENEAEKQTWLARIAMLERALATTQVFSISIIPADPSEKQTWYHKAAISYKAPKEWDLPFEVQRRMHAQNNASSTEATSSSASSSTSSEPATEGPQNLFELTPAPSVVFSSSSMELPPEVSSAFDNLLSFESLLPNRTNDERPATSGPISCGFKRSRSFSTTEESPDSPAPTFNGFFAPFLDFSSSIAHAKYDPNHLPRSVIRINVFAMDEMENLRRGLENETIRNNVEGIVDAFVDDEHSRGLGLVVLEPSRNQIKTLFFEKVY